MTDHVTFFPDWRRNPYLDQLAEDLGPEGWRCAIVGRKGLLAATLAAAVERGTVHIHWFEGFNPGRSWIGGIIAWLYLIPLWVAGRQGRVIWTVHNLTPHEGFPRLLGKRFLRALARISSRILVHFDQTRELVAVELGVDMDKVFVTAPSSLGRMHGPGIDPALARMRLGALLPAGDLLFAQVGCLRSYKQPVLTIASFREAAPPSAGLLLAGPCDDDGMRADILRASAGDPRIVVHFGYLSNEQLVAALCAADWFVCPYARIDNPGAVNLAVAYECPVIGPDLAPIRALTSGHSAKLYPIDEPASNGLREAFAAAPVTRSGTRIAQGATGRAGPDTQGRLTAQQYVLARARRKR